MDASLAHKFFWATNGNFKIEDFLKLTKRQRIFYLASAQIYSDEAKKEKAKKGR